MFEVIDHFLYHNNQKTRFVASVNHGIELKSQRFIIIHGSGGPDLTSALEWSIDPDSKTSAHIVIGRNGEVIQLVPLNSSAWHAGASEWDGSSNLNEHSIGIELVNAGFCQPAGAEWVSTFGKVYLKSELFFPPGSEEDVGWQTFPQIQLETAAMVCAALKKFYNIEQILGHEQVSPGRKWDPGPAFKITEFSALVESFLSDSAPVAPSDQVQINQNEPKKEDPNKAVTYKVQNLDSGEVKEFILNSAFQPTSLLSVPYIPQIGPEADAHNNDCGAASVLMLFKAYHQIEMTVDEFYSSFNISKDVYLSVSQLRNALSSRGISTEYKANLTVQDVFTKLAQGIPMIVLFRYKVLADAGLTFSKFQGPHFAVVIGMDIKNIYINDPLYKEPGAGNAKAYPMDLFWKAWTEVGQDSKNPNPTRAAIFPTTGIGFQVTRKVKLNSNLNIRSGPGSKHNIVGVGKKGEIFEIRRELAGWGEIGDGQWFNLAYTLPI